jgi:hypothetical protein
MPSTTYQSSFPAALYPGNLQDERITNDARALARARDYNTHDVEIRAIQNAIGTYPAGTQPTGSILRRLYDIEGSSGHTQVHSHDGSDHSGKLSMSNVEVNITNTMGTIIQNWFTKVMGTGDLDGDSILSLQDVLTAVALNKEVLDDLILTGFDYPWQVPTGGGPGKKGGPGPGGGGSPDKPEPGGDGGFDPSEPAMPVTDVWTGLGADGGGYFDQPVGLLVNFETGEQYGVQRFKNVSGTPLTGLQDMTDIEYAEVWGTPALGDGYGMYYFRKPSTTGISNDSGVITNAIGGLVFEDKQAKSTVTDEIAAMNLGDIVYDVPTTADATGSISLVDYDGGTGDACGYVHLVAIASGDGGVRGRIIIPDSGTINIGVILSSPVGNPGGADTWDIRTLYKIDASATTTVNDTTLPPVSADEMFRDDVVTGLAVTKNQTLHLSFRGLNSSAFQNNMVIHGLVIEYTALT